MYGVSELRTSDLAPLLHDFGKCFIFGDFPFYENRFWINSTSTKFKWVRSELGPNHHTIRFWVAGCHSKGKRVS